MTGYELAKAVRNCKGKLSVPVLLGADVSYIYVQKADLIRTLTGIGNTESGMRLEREDGGDDFYLAHEQD